MEFILFGFAKALMRYSFASFQLWNFPFSLSLFHIALNEHKQQQQQKNNFFLPFTIIAFNLKILSFLMQNERKKVIFTGALIIIILLLTKKKPQCDDQKAIFLTYVMTKKWNLNLFIRTNTHVSKYLSFLTIWRKEIVFRTFRLMCV